MAQNRFLSLKIDVGSRQIKMGLIMMSSRGPRVFCILFTIITLFAAVISVPVDKEAISEFDHSGGDGGTTPDNSKPIREKSPDEIASQWTWWKFEKIPDRENPFRGDKPFPWKLLAFCIFIGLFISYSNASRRHSKVKRR